MLVCFANIFVKGFWTKGLFGKHNLRPILTVWFLNKMSFAKHDLKKLKTKFEDQSKIICG
jgi:hypothetical protein